MDLLDSLILGIVEGLTEFLPISSTGHLILTSKLLGLKQTEFLKSFEIAIQLGAILAVLIGERERLIKNRNIWKKIMVGFIPTGIIGFSLYKVIKGVFLESYTIVIISLIVGGFVLIAVDLFLKGRGKHTIDSLSLKGAFFIGVCQSIAVIPGVSRSGATIVGGLLAGLNRKEAAEFSFLLAIPTMFAATFYDLFKTGGSFTAENWSLLFTGFISAFIVAIITMKTFLGYLKNHGFLPFGIYRIVMGAVYYYVFIL